MRKSIAIAFVCLLSLACVGTLASGRSKKSAGPPIYQVDPFWPKQLPNNWVMAQVGGLTVDRQNHIWVLQRPRSNTPNDIPAAQNPPRSECCVPAPPVLEFDQQGNLLKSWGGPGAGYDWPLQEHSIHVDAEGDIWIGGNGATDRQVLKFSNDGKFIMQIGHASNAPPNSNDTTILGRPAGIEVDDAAHEVYIADGYLNRRVIVYDSQTGAFKRLWGAYGHTPNDVDPGPYNPSDPPDQQFRTAVHCIHFSHEGTVYVCDRGNDRVQAFTKQGKFLSEFTLKPATLGLGSFWDFAFSHDPGQEYMLVADGENNVIWTVKRSDGSIVGSTGHGGRNAGQFHWVHQIAADSDGNLYTGEVDTGKRVQKFVLVRK